MDSDPMMMIGSCDPASRGDTFNTTTLQSGNAFVEIRWTWDGVSTNATGCNGPLVSVRGWNQDTVSHWAHFQGRSGNPRSIELKPGTDVTLLPQQLHPRGFDTYADCQGVRLTDSAVTP